MRLGMWAQSRWMWVILALALVTRLAGVVWMDLKTDNLKVAFGNLETDCPSSEYATLARNMLAGCGFSQFVVEGYRPEGGEARSVLGRVGFSIFTVEGVMRPSAYMPPAYAYFLAGVFAALGDGAFAFIVVQLVNVVLGAILCLITAQLGKLLFGRTVGILAGILMAGFPTFVFVTTRAHAVNMYVLLNYAIILVLISAKDTTRLRNSVFAGVLCGVLALFRPEIFAYVPILVLWLMISAAGIQAVAKNVLVFVVGLVLVVTPWTVRNYQVFGKLLPITALGGFNLWRGQNEMTTGSGRGANAGWTTPEIQQQIIMLPATDDWEVRRDNIYLKAAQRFMREHPRRVLELVPRKLFYYWILDTGDSRTRPVIYWLPWFLLLPFFLIGLFESFRYGLRCSLLWGYLLVACGLTSVFVVLARYRLFTDPIALILAALGLCTVFNYLRARAQKQPSAETFARQEDQSMRQDSNGLPAPTSQ
jgi:4-amino-4-deoxy-L-arabinose transferase-like glycosyltransferase